MTKVPLLDLAAQNGALESELTAAFQRVLRSCCYILGPEVEAFEKEAAALCWTKHAVAVSSGTDAILLALMALGIKPGDEVLVPAFTFFATAGCPARLGATPVFVDVNPHTFNFDIADAYAKVTPRTRAILPVHLFGQSADMNALCAFATGHGGLDIVEDCAQSLGARWYDRPVGSFGKFGTYSFFPSKNLGGFGDGGLLATDDNWLASHARVLRVHGMSPKYRHTYLGGNFRMDPLQAALLRVKLPHLAGYNARRAANAARYREALSALPGVADNAPGHPSDATLLLPVDFSKQGIWNQFTLRVPGAGRRDSLKAALAAADIGSEIYYPLSLDQQICFQKNCRGGETIRVAHQLAAEVLSIPIFPDLTEEQLDAVIAAIATWLAANPLRA